MVILVLLLLAGGGSLFLADILTQRDKDDAAAMQRLTRLFQDHEDLAPRSVVKLRQGNKRDDREGPGMHVEVTPSAAVLARPGGMRGLVLSIVRELPQAYAPSAPAFRWV